MTQRKSCLIAGAHGFIGSAITAAAHARGYAVTAMDRGNYATLKGTGADLLINAAGNSSKWLDERDPVRGYELSVTSTLRILHDFHCRDCIHISSGAVYPDEAHPENNGEDTALDPSAMSPYGFHKWMAEQVVGRYAPRSLILRLGGCVGAGLKKNAVFDLLNGGRLFVHPDSEFQYMDTRDTANALFDLYEGYCADGRDDTGRLTLNLSARGTVRVRQIAEWIGIALDPAWNALPRIRAEINVEKAARRLVLPDTAATVKRFVETPDRMFPPSRADAWVSQTLGHPGD